MISRIKNWWKKYKREQEDAKERNRIAIDQLKSLVPRIEKLNKDIEDAYGHYGSPEEISKTQKTCKRVRKILKSIK